MIKQTALEIVEDIEKILKDIQENPQFKRDLSFLLQDHADHLLTVKERSSQNLKDSKEVAGLAPGTRVSWEDHLGLWSGTVTEVHHSKVRRVVRNIRMWNDGHGYSHEITRVGTYKDPALVIEIDGGKGGTALKLKSQINIQELVMAE